MEHPHQTPRQRIGVIIADDVVSTVPTQTDVILAVASVVATTLLVVASAAFLMV